MIIEQSCKLGHEQVSEKAALFRIERRTSQSNEDEMNIHQAIDILQTEFQYTVSPECVTVTEHCFFCLMGDLLRALYVEPGYRGLGYGRELVQLAREKHGSPLRLECNSELVPYYEQLGFKKTRTTRRGEYHYMQQVS